MSEQNYTIRESDDKERVSIIRAALKANGGYCPCQIIKSETTRCMCQEFLDKIHDTEFYGTCHCGLYVKEKKEES